ncbi:MAG: peptide-N-glycosidase [Ignavibacteria bacterium]|nr:peptide-N-glycosidase [Ignavibacteria bacterium]
MKIIFTLLILIATDIVFSENGDTINIVTHNKTKVVTDPSKGFNAYKSWSVFPSEDIKYRRAILYVTYQCPDSQRCGEWDYIDNIYLRRRGSVNDTALDIELARMISPYGSRFTPDWKFTWKADITDFSFLLHDSVEIEFNHTGYESNTDRGWLVTLDFELTEGPPVMEILGFEKLWTGNFPYGDSKDDIENYLKPVSFENKLGADIVRLRILQTGHGMDDFENCAEFCNKYRKIYFNNELIEQKQIWRECADNPLFPQAGTWIFDRANWCPGAMVIPDTYEFKITDSSENTIDIDMEPYVNPNKPSANYVFSSYLFYYKKPTAVHDLTIEEIISPSDEEIYSKDNPLCMDGKVLIKNNGSEPSFERKIIVYGFGEFPMGLTFISDTINPGESVYKVLPKMFTEQPKDGKGEFNIRIKELNYEDEYPLDNSKTVFAEVPPVWDRDIKILYRTNKNPLGTILSMKDNYKNEYLGWKPDKPDTLYEFYFENLKPGCYELTIKDTANDGLDFWFNPEGGYGYVRVTDKEGKLIKAFNSDFGSGIRQQFIVTDTPAVKEDITPILNIFPIRNPGKFFCDIFLNERQSVTLEITTEDKKKIVYKKKLKKFKDGMVDVDISKVPDGFYFVNVVSKDKTVSKKMKVKRD